MRAVLPLAALLLGAAAPHALGRGGERRPVQRESLEQFLERARAHRQELQARFSAEVALLVKELEGDEKLPTAKELAVTVERLIALGAEATPLLVPFIDPGSAPLEKERVRAQQVSTALARMDTSAITDALLELLARATNDGKRNALRVLQSSSERARVRPPIDALFRASEGSLKQAALRALIDMGGRENDALLGEVLASSDENLVALALVALGDTKNAAAAEQVRKLLASTASGARHVTALLAYFRAVPAALQDQDVAAFVRIAQASSVPLETRVTIIDALAKFAFKPDAELRRNLQPLVDSTDRRMHESTLVLLSCLGDKGARRELFKEADEVVDKNPRWADAYVRRADLHARVGEDEDAIKDYREALSVGRDDPLLQPATYVKLARALTRRGKLKDACETLKRAPLSYAELQALADDAEFAPLRNSKWGREAFGLK